MPVRIYEIAKKLNLESKFVLVRAKELGIAAAKVPSSSLDKITAEFLEKELLPLAQSAPSAPAQEFAPIAIIRVPDAPTAESAADSDYSEDHEAQDYVDEPEATAPEAQPVPQAAHAPERRAAPAPVAHIEPAHEPVTPSMPVAHAAIEVPVPRATPPEPTPDLPPPAPEPSFASRSEEHVHREPAHAPAESKPALPQTPAPGQVAATSPVVPTPEPKSVTPAPTPVAESPAQPPPAAAPKLGEKIGSIDLSKLGYRRPGSDPRGRDGRPGAPGDQRPGAPAGQGQQPNRPAPPGQPQRPGGPQQSQAPRPGSPQPSQAPRPGGPQPSQAPRPGGPQQSQAPRPGGPPFQNRPGGPNQGGYGQNRPGYGQNRPGGQGQGGRPGFGQNRYGGGQGYSGQGRGAGPSQRPAGPAKPQLNVDAPVIQLRPPIVVRELAEKLGRKPFQVIADLMQMGVFATVTQTIDPEVAVKICAKSGFKFETEKRDKAAHTVNVPRDQRVELDQEDRLEDMKTRPPVITIMGHVDHGKTSLLDVIRKANVVAGEAGGITQHIGAYSIAYPHPERKDELMQLTFLDTPGHAAFSAMRARGANVTDIVVLVVAANDGVMPQTLEALAHAQAAKVPIIVAVNKCDHPAANPMRVKQQLQDKGLVPDDWGGDTLYVECSALTKQGVDKLIESILLQAELMELKANHERKAKGNVIESGVEPGGPVATVLVRKGTLRVGDVIICGQHHGRVRAMMNDDGVRQKEAGPSCAVRVLGLDGVPDAGSEFSAVDNEKAARELAEEREEARKKSDLEGVRPRRRTLEDIFTNIDQMSAKILKVIVKADTQGSVEAICEALRKIETAKVQLEIIHSAVGAISEGDVLLASSADAVILGFHSRVDSSAAETAKREGVQIKLYAIIYELIDHVKEAMAGLLDPLLKEIVIGQAEVRKIFDLSKGGRVAGCAVINGRLVRGKMRVRRRTHIIYEGVSLTLKRFQDEVNEVRAGLECGIRLEGFDDFQEGDFIECYSVEKVAQKLA
jgi:translation initiation factor IF-2